MSATLRFCANQGRRSIGESLGTAGAERSSAVLSGQQGAASGLVLIPDEGGGKLLRGSLLQFLHEVDDSLGGFRFNQQVEVLRHQDPADQEEAGFLAELAERLDRGPAEALTRK